MNTDFKVSIIIPAYNEAENIKVVTERLEQVLKSYHDYEIIFVDDGSQDNTLKLIKELRQQDEKIYYLSLSRNFGHQNALKAGLDYARGDCVISMDADLQHPPELIPEMIAKWLQGYEIVHTVREKDPEESWFKNATAAVFYKLMNLISDIRIEPGTADFRLLDRKVVDVLKGFNESFLFFRGLVPWLGFNRYGLKYRAPKRFAGKSKYSFKKMISLALMGVTSFSIKPLRISTFLGLLFSISSFIYALYAIFASIFSDKVVSGWTSMIVSILFLGGVQLLVVGIIGEYLGKLFIESKKRPLYIIKEKSR